MHPRVSPPTINESTTCENFLGCELSVQVCVAAACRRLSGRTQKTCDRAPVPRLAGDQRAVFCISFGTLLVLSSPPRCLRKDLEGGAEILLPVGVRTERNAAMSVGGTSEPALLKAPGKACCSSAGNWRLGAVPLVHVRRVVVAEASALCVVFKSALKVTPTSSCILAS